MSSTVSELFSPRRSYEATVRGLVVASTAFASLAMFIVTVITMAFMLLGVGVLVLPVCLMGLRWLAESCRILSARSDVPIASPYLPDRGSGSGLLGWVQRCHEMLTDPATWRDLIWAMLNTLVGFVLGLLPTVLLVYAIEGVVLAAGLWQPMQAAGGFWYGIFPMSNWEFAFLGGLLAVAVFGLWVCAAPLILRLHARFCHLLLSPTERSRLTSRVQHLADTRAEVIDIQAAELRRIERDLHDGTQARLVAIGMKLGAMERYLETDTAAVRDLLTEAREASVRALGELRDLIRGIHPPVLAERGLTDAVHALALESPLDVDLVVELPRRLYLPLESTAYFAISELLTNALKHAAARQVSIEVRERNGVLTIIVIDDGHGGADISKGSGLRGIERRCATFGGSLHLRSPPGGPTIVTLEMPCESFLPKTSTS
jgi:signal transduction histidine kinase